MKWKKLGQIYFSKSIDNYLLTHASNPLAVHINKNIYRIFFSGRNNQNKSSIGYVDIDIIKKKVISTCDKTIFKFGNSDSFYSHGVSIGNLYKINEKSYIQFMAWQIPQGGHWRGDIGRLSLSSDLKTLILDPEEVFLGCDQEDKISLSYSWVIYDDGIFKMWYGSTINWKSDNGEMIHVIKYATSKDGYVWKRMGLAIPFELGVAQAFSRPSVIKNKEGFHMWFSYRSGNGTKYRIGYAHSIDGLNWNRKKNSGIDVSKNGWDSEMICYPFVFEHNDDLYMLYNGNNFGKNGFGLAIMEK